MRRKVLPFLGLSLMLVLSACGSGGSGGKDTAQGTQGTSSTGEAKSDDGQKIELRMTWWGSQTRHDLTMKVLKLFEEKHPNITIKPEYSGWDGYFDKLSTQVAGANAPDLIQMDYAFISDYAKRGALLDLTPYTQNGELKTDKHDKSMLDAGTIDGKLYAVTLGVNAPGVIYNTAVFRELGIEEPQESWTWDDFKNITDKIAKAKGKGYYGSPDISGTTNMFEIWVRQSGDSLFKDGQLGATKDDFLGWFKYWDELRKSGAVTPAEVTASLTNALETRPITLGTAAMEFAWSNQVVAFQQLMKNQNDELKMQVIPHSAGEKKIGEYLKPSMFISGYAKTAHPKEVAMVIDFLVNDPDAAKILGSERGIPVNSDIRNQLKETVSKTERMTYDFIDTVSKHSSPISPPYPQGYAEIDKNFKSASEQIAFGQNTADQIVPGFIQDSNDILNKSK